MKKMPSQRTRRRRGFRTLPVISSERQVLISCLVLSLADIIELRKLRRAREGIDVGKLQKGDAKKKKKRLREEEVGGLQMGAGANDEEYVRCPAYSSFPN
jgi:hypothetical protein